MFQSTPLREGRRNPSNYLLYTYIMFQSTPLREGRLYHGIRVYVVNKVSIHAPARGATKIREC